MTSIGYRVKTILAYYWRAKTKVSSDNVFVQDFVDHIMDSSRTYYAFAPLEHARKLLQNRKDFIPYEDHGASNRSGQRSVGEIAKTSLSPKYQCYWLFQLVNHYNYSKIVEFGTALGLSSAYMAMANTKSRLITMEGNPGSAHIANDLHQRLGLRNIDIKVGSFEQLLPEVLESMPLLDLVFVDGHHDGEATIKYVNWVLPQCREGSCIVLDDIYWSKSMTEAWHYISKLPQVRVAIDLYDVGIIFIGPKDSIDHYTLIDKRWKL